MPTTLFNTVIELRIVHWPPTGIGIARDRALSILRWLRSI